jgi:uncharacterized protein
MSKLYRREKYLSRIRAFYDADDIIKVITGVRRCGKSCLMRTIADELIERGVPEENIIYINLDSREYNRITTQDQLDELLSRYDAIKGLKYLFIDEVQNVKGFEIIINSFREDGAYSIFITGSNSYLLSGELMTKLTGRYLEFEIFTLTYDEYEAMKEFYKKPIDPILRNEMDNYILGGGFPRAVQLDDLESKRTYASGVIAEIFQKDIRRRVHVGDRHTFESVQKYMINNFGATTSIRSLERAMKQNDIQISRPTLTRYINILCDAKILYAVDRFDMKSKRSINGEKKYYLSDLAFYYATNADNRINYGPVLENIAYFYARSKDYTVSIGRIGKLECDFILRDWNLNYSYLQVAMTIMDSRATEDREYRPLESIHDNYKKYVATTDQLLQRRNGIEHINLIEFIKNDSNF